jgi:hypothetical protein
VTLPRSKLREDEEHWLTWVVDYAVRVARPPWERHYHTRNSKGSDSGFPDLVLLRPPRLVVAELKTETGRVTVAQWAWLDDFAACGAESYVWRPSDRAEIERILS